MAMNAITIINNNPLSIKEYSGQRVVTFKDIDTLHQRPEGTAKRNFTENRKHFIKGVDYLLVKPSDFQRYEIRTLEIPNRGLTVFTEPGYLMLVKSFNDDLAWAVQRALVNSYFKGKINPPPSDYLEACGVIQPLPAAPADEDIARQFLQAISAALESGEYYLLRKRSHGGTAREGTLLGIYDDTTVTLICSLAYEIYARFTGSTASVRSLGQTLRPILTRSGLVAPRTRQDEKQTIKRKPYCCMYIQRQTANALSGYTAPLLLN